MLQKYFKTLKNKKHLNQVLLTNQKHFFKPRIALPGQL